MHRDMRYTVTITCIDTGLNAPRDGETTIYTGWSPKRIVQFLSIVPLSLEEGWVEVHVEPERPRGRDPFDAPTGAWTGMSVGLGIAAIFWLIIYAVTWTLMHRLDWPDIFEPLRMLGF